MKPTSLPTSTLIALLLAAGSTALAAPEPEGSPAANTRSQPDAGQRNSRAEKAGNSIVLVAELKGAGGNESDAPAPEQLFVNTAWKTPYGTIFEFQPDQRGIRTFGESDRTAFNWKRLPEGLVEVRGPIRKGELEVTWYFRFVRKTEAYYGPHTNEVNRLLEKQN
jgi:hypothetical protein